MGQRRCEKCGEKKKVTRHHIYGKYGLCGLRHDSSLPLECYLAWIGEPYDEIDLLFWNDSFANICRSCHDEFHIIFSKLMRECDAMQSEEPLKVFLEESHGRKMGQRV